MCYGINVNNSALIILNINLKVLNVSNKARVVWGRQSKRLHLPELC